jgi:hypothetical protein
MHGGSPHANLRWQGLDQHVVRDLQHNIAQGAAAEGIAVPVEGETLYQFAGPRIDAIAFEHDCPIVRCSNVGKPPVAGQQDALFRIRLFDKIAIAAAALRDRRVVSRDAQPAAQSGQHLVAEKAQMFRHGPAFGRRRLLHLRSPPIDSANDNEVVGLFGYFSCLDDVRRVSRLGFLVHREPDWRYYLFFNSDNAERRAPNRAIPRPLPGA